VVLVDPLHQLNPEDLVDLPHLVVLVVLEDQSHPVVLVDQKHLADLVVLVDQHYPVVLEDQRHWKLQMVPVVLEDLADQEEVMILECLVNW
jgi:hypothetical protein